ncbi:MAG: hypothetical protein HQK54_09825 [Oligoflexales bacterium]|nr:hypothetical protein [Oligoflexales bacterium]
MISEQARKNLVYCFSIPFVAALLTFTGFDLNTEQTETKQLRKFASEEEAAAIIQKNENLWESEDVNLADVNFRGLDEALLRWYRIKIGIDPEKDRELAARFEFPHLYLLDIYLSDNSGNILDTYKVGLTRDRLVKNRRIYDSKVIYPFSVKKGESCTLYVKVRSPILRMPITIMDKKIFDLWSIFASLCLGGYFGGFLCIILYNAFIYVSTREKVTLYYVIYHSLVWIFNYFYVGLGYIYPGVVNFSNVVLILCYLGISFLIMGTVFIYSFLDLEKRSPYLAKVARIYIYLNMLLFVCGWSLPLGSIVHVAIGSCIIGSTAAVIGFFHIWNENDLKTFLLAWAGLFAAIILHWFSFFGLVPVNQISLVIHLVGGIWEAVFLSMAIGEKIKRLKKEKQEIAYAINTSVSGETSSDATTLEAESFNMVKRNVSIVFIDVVGFSQVSQKIGSHRSFKLLSELMTLINETIQKYSGTIDRSLGDGVLAVFGADENDMNLQSHADRAFLSAIEIQTKSIEKGVIGTFTAKIPFPLRIGINADDVYIGNLGKSRRVDYTMIGSGVNFASHLEHACNPFRILMSPGFKEKLSPNIYDIKRLSQVIINIKHKKDYIIAYEYNPGFNRKELVIKNEKRYWKVLEKAMLESRIKISKSKPVFISSKLGRFEIKDYCHNGFGVIGDNSVGKTSRLFGTIKTKDNEINELLEFHMLDELEFEVRWSRVSSKGLKKHGFQIIGLNEQQKSIVYDCLCRN